MPYTNLLGVPSPPEGLNPNTFASVAGGVHAETIFSPYDLYTPQELTTLYYNHKKRSPGISMILKMSGMTRGVKAPTTGHYEKPWNRDHLIIGSVIDQATVTPTITLDASSMFTVPASTGDVLGSYPIVREVYELPNRKQFIIETKDTTVNPHTVTIRAWDNVAFVAGDWVAGTRVWHVTNARGEGAPLNTGKISRVDKYENTFVNFNSSVSATGTDLTNKPYWDKVINEEGIWTGSYFAIGMEDVMYNHEEDKDNWILFGRQATNLTEAPPLLGYSVPVNGTEGLLEFGLTAGYDRDWDPAVGYDMQDFDDIFSIYEGERVSTELMVWQGFGVYQNVENMLVDYTRQTDIDFTSTNPDNSFTLKIDFWGIEKSGYRVYFKKLEAFNSVKGAGTSGYDYPNWQVFTPWGMTNDKTTGDEIGFIGYEWKQLGDYNRENIMIKLDGTGFTGSFASYSDDILQCGFRSEIAAHNACANTIVIQRPVP